MTKKIGPSTSLGCQNLSGHPRDLKMVAKGPGWTYLNLEILTGQFRWLNMAQFGRLGARGGFQQLPPLASLGLSFPLQINIEQKFMYRKFILILLTKNITI